MDDEGRPLFCNCKNFRSELLKFIREISTEKDEILKWQKFQTFAEEFPSRFPQMICDVDCIYTVKSCEQELCSALINRQCKIMLKKIELSNFLVNIVIHDYIKECHFDSFNLSYLEHHTTFYDFLETFYNLTAYGIAEHMKLLLNLDFVPRLRFDSARLMLTTYRMLGDCMWVDIQGTEFQTGDIRSEIDVKAKEIVKLATDSFYQGNYNEKCRRMYLATIAVRAARLKLSKKEDSAERFIHCLRIFFSATRDPLLSVNEVRLMLYAYLSVLKKLSLLQSLTEEFVKLMPESPANTKPRNLTDLSRNHIREHLKMCCNFNLPAAVEKLNVPPLLKNFILEDVIDMSRKKENVPPKELLQCPS